ncbi:DUF6992 family protein [Chitinophaga agri]|uniref:Uncharacterized protein n=1 Tax=Chitinophaga agri TaxID=2703787 RepID=A0A6B9ZFS5_9BACT|nr:hypothetical protein [Chitinophaga agri]QHS60977.1 hypothetical protein GWR21_15650 [Chitinophaga agri]
MITIFRKAAMLKAVSQDSRLLGACAVRHLLVMILLLLTVTASAQDTTYLYSYNQKRINSTKTAMLVLGGWGVANLATGLIGNSTAGGEAKYFHRMNAVWGVVNMGIAAASYLGNRRLDPGKYNWQGSVNEQHKIEKIFLVNGALDLAYMAGGLFMREHGKTKLMGTGHDRWKGYGNSLIMQGAFLLLFDGINFTLHHHQGKGLFSRFEQLQLTVAPGGAGMVYQW